MQGGPSAPYGGPYAGATPLLPFMMPSPVAPSGPSNHAFNMQGGVDQFAHQQQLQWINGPGFPHQHLSYFAPMPPTWGTRPNGNPQTTTSLLQPASSQLQNLVKHIERKHVPQQLTSPELKDRIRAATSKIEQLKQITRRIQQLSGNQLEMKDHRNSTEEIMVQSTRESAPYSSTSGFVDALNDSHQEPAEAAKVGKHKGLQPVDLNSSNRFDRLEELFLAEATAKALKASIEQLLGPLHRVRTGEGTKAETEAWKEYETRQQKVKQYRTRRKKHRRQVAQRLREEREAFNRADTAADEWRAQRLAQDIARTRLQQMEKAANAEALEKKRQLEQDVNSLLLLERLQKLRALRIAKLRRQGHIFPEEDDVFMARVQQGAKEEAAEATAGLGDTKEDAQHAMGLGLEANPEPGQVDLSNEASAQAHSSGSRGNKEARGGSDGSRQAEPELQHYYLDSATNMGRLIEVRRAWDTFLSPDGIAIPGHWVPPPDPPGPPWAQFMERLDT